MITKERLRELLDYCPESGVFRWLEKTNRRTVVGSVAGSMHTGGYVVINLDGVRFYAHRLAWLWMTGQIPPDQIDHKNGIRDDNRWDNLRSATSGDNHQNICKPKHNTSGYLGVYWSKPDNKWRARIEVSGRRIGLGFFKTAEHAGKAYLEAKKKFHKFNPIQRGEL